MPGELLHIAKAEAAPNHLAAWAINVLRPECELAPVKPSLA